MLKIDESVTLPRRQYEALLRMAQAVDWYADRASKVELREVSGYLLDAFQWESIVAPLQELRVQMELTVAEENTEAVA